MKKKIILITFALAIATFMLVLRVQAAEKNEKTLAEIEDEIAEMKDKKKELEDSKKELELNLEQIEKEVADKKLQITTVSQKLDELESEIPEQQKEAEKEVVFLQQTKQSSGVLDSIFEGGDGMTSARNMSLLIDDSIESIQQLEVMKKEQELASIQLEVEQQELESLSEKVEEDIDEAEHELDTAEADLDAEAAAQEAYEDAGCKKGEVLGVTCGLPPEPKPKPAPKPAPASKQEESSSSDSDESSNSEDTAENSGSNYPNTGAFYLPLGKGYTTCGWGCYENHRGLDFGSKNKSAPIYSVQSGVVILARGGCAPRGGYLGNTCNGGFGNYVLILHNYNGKAVYSRYAHLSQINVSGGQQVTADTQIGVMGHSGSSTATHLHFEVIEDSNKNGVAESGERVNPEKYITVPPNYVTFTQR